MAPNGSTSNAHPYLLEEPEQYCDLLDIFLVAKQELIPVNSGVLAMHSVFFRNMLKDLKADEGSKTQGKLSIPLDESVSIEDARLMLSFICCARRKIETMEEAHTLISLADKYDVPFLAKVIDEDMCNMVSELQFIPQDNSSGGVEECKSAAWWLATAERLDLRNVKIACECFIIQDMITYGGETEKVKQAMASLQEWGVTTGTVCNMMAAMMDVSGPACVTISVFFPQTQKYYDVKCDPGKYRTATGCPVQCKPKGMKRKATEEIEASVKKFLE
eukprot:evm.model.scf_53EXC.1 EVM.evm.TU.scf_53EXC.1   scf_53EXC:683-2305(+)